MPSLVVAVCNRFAKAPEEIRCGQRAVAACYLYATEYPGTIQVKYGTHRGIFNFGVRWRWSASNCGSFNP